MNLKNKIKEVIKNPLWIIVFLNNRGIYLLNDKKYLELLYKLEMGYKLDIENPITFNEKLQWLKLYDRRPEYTNMVDKYEAKKYIANIIGEEYIIPTLGVWEKFEDIDFNQLPNQFVLKCTHDSGGLIICKDKNTLNTKASKKKINKCLKNKFYYSGREWPYKNVKPRVIAEKYMVDESGTELKDYKFFCFNGVVKEILVCSNRDGNFKNTNFYDVNWNLQPFTREKHKNTNKSIRKPKNLDEMILIAEKLSKDIPFVRVDLYEINNRVFWGELTFYPSAGFEGFEPKKYDKILGDMLELPKERKIEK